MKNIFIMTLALFITILIFSGCENQNPLAHNSNANDASQVDLSGQPLDKNGPLSQEQLAAITLPDEQVRVAEKDLTILKSKSAKSLQKRFFTSWLVAKGASGWIYTGDAEHGRCWLYFPQYALNQATVITLDWESSGFLEGGAEFSPHGVQFNHPLTVWISYKDADLADVNEEDLKIWYFNEEIEMWELIGDVVDTENKMVGGLLHHFSRYAIGYD